MRPATSPLVLKLVLLAGLALGFGTACKRPETALRERPVQRVEVVQTVEGMTPEEVHSLEAQLLAGLGAPGDPADAAMGPVRVFRLTLEGKPNPNAHRSRGKTWVVSTGSGVLIGAFLPVVGYTIWATWRSAAIAAGVGGAIGFVYGPIWYRDNQALLNELGYLPWDFRAEWEVLERRPGLADEVVAGSRNAPPPFAYQTPHLDLRPHLKPLPPESRSPVDIRQANLRAYGEALVKRVHKKN